MNTPQKFSYLFLVTAMVGAFPLSSPQAGFDWVGSAPATTKVAPVQGVEQIVLPPQTGVATREQGTGVLPDPIAPARVPAPPISTPIISYSDETSAVPMMAAPTQIVDQPVVYTQPSRVPVASVPAVSDAPAPSYSSSIVTQPPSVYPPRGNVPSRPLGAGVSSGRPVPVMPITPRQTRMSVGAVPVINPEPVISAPALPAPAPTVRVVTTAPVTAPAMTAPVGPRAVIEGFGTNVPLSLAFEQIVPAGWTIEDQAYLDRSMMVSWAGGRPFDKVLEDMLYAHGVRVTVTGSSVVLFKASGAPLMSVPNATALAPALPPSMPARVIETLPPVMPPMTSSVSMPLPERMVDDVSVVPAAPVAGAPEFVQAPLGTSGFAKFDAAQIDLFSGRTGEKVQDVLARWGRMAHVQVMWNVGADLTLPQSFAVNANFPRAVERLLNIYHEDAVRPVADLETNPASGSAAILRVVRAP